MFYVNIGNNGLFTKSYNNLHIDYRRFDISLLHRSILYGIFVFLGYRKDFQFECQLNSKSHSCQIPFCFLIVRYYGITTWLKQLLMPLLNFENVFCFL